MQFFMKAKKQAPDKTQLRKYETIGDYIVKDYKERLHEYAEE